MFMSIVSMSFAFQVVPVLAKTNSNENNSKKVVQVNNSRAGIGSFIRNFGASIQSGWQNGVNLIKHNENNSEGDKNYHVSSTTTPIKPKVDDEKGKDNSGRKKDQGPCIFIAPTSTTSQSWINKYWHGYAGLPLCQQVAPAMYQQLLQCVANFVPPPQVNQPPVISGVSQMVTSSTTATINWQTNESADSTVSYATSTPVSSSPSLNTNHNSGFVTSHQIFLTGLTPNTIYYYQVTSTDSGSLSSTSSTFSFTTPSVPIPPPVISSIASSSVTSIGATISWFTDTLSTSNVFYATSTPVLSAPYLGTSRSLILTTSHIIPLSGLTASSTYYFLVSSTDAQGNAATSSEMNFSTQ